MAYTWSEDLATGNAAIDAQHKELIKAMNDMLDACFSGQGHAKLDPTIQFMVDYAEKHFADEESLQMQCRYPDYQNHKKLHDAFKVTVKDLAKHLMEEGPTTALVRKVNSSVGDWLVSHIKNEDKKVAKYIRENS